MYKIYKDTTACSSFKYIIVDCYSDQYFLATLTKFDGIVLKYQDRVRNCLEKGTPYAYLGECKYRKDILLTLPMLDLLADI